MNSPFQGSAAPHMTQQRSCSVASGWRGEVPILSPEKPYLLDAKVRAMFDWKSRLDDLFLRSKAMNFIPHIFCG